MKLGAAWKSITYSLSNYWSSLLVALAAFLALATLLLYRLANLVSGFSNPELASRAQTVSLENLKQSPLNLPHSFWQFMYQHFHFSNTLALRSVSAAVGLLCVYSFYYVMRKWYSQRLAVLGTVLFSTAAWFLHIARLATPESLMFGLFLLFAAGVWLEQGKHKRSAAISCGLLAAALLYVPGMVWFVAPVLIWQQRRLRNAFTHLALWQRIISILLFLSCIAPLVYGFTLHLDLYKAWLGLPEQWPSLAQFGRNLLAVPTQLFVKGPDDPVRWLGRLPLVDWFGTLMFVVGVYAYRFKLYLDRTWFLIYLGIIGSILIALGGPVTMSLLMPFIYLVVVGGLALMLQQWFTVFPRNPFARSVGVTLIILAVLSSSFYQLNHYFIAWPHTPETKAVFTNQR